MSEEVRVKSEEVKLEVKREKLVFGVSANLADVVQSQV
jgi:hypothetical protein